MPRSPLKKSKRLLPALFVALLSSAAFARAGSGIVPQGALMPDVWPKGAKLDAPAPQVPQDACAAIAADATAYAACEDRLARIARMREAAAARRAAFQDVPGTQK